jgi:flavorubredoxin
MRIRTYQASDFAESGPNRPKTARAEKAAEESMALTTEIAPDVYRISVFASPFNLQFNHFVVRDEAPLLFHTGLRGMFPEVRDAVSRLLPLGELRKISFSHFEADECGSLNEWLAAAPKAEVLCSQAGALVSVNDFIGREARGLADGETFSTGKYRFRHCRTPHLPHGWDAGVLLEETLGTLFCSDLCHQNGDVEPLTEADVLGRTRSALEEYQNGVLAEYTPYTPLTSQYLHKLADLKPKTLAIMHGSSFTGDCAKMLLNIDALFRELFGHGMKT